MSVASCPICGEKVTLPPPAEGALRVRCPWCQEAYALEAALATVPPQLIVLEQATDAAARESNADNEVPVILADDSLGSERTAPAFAMDRASPSVQASYQRRPQKSPLGEIFKIVAGGAVGLVLGQFILWWAVERDPFHIGPSISKVAPWIVPARYRVGQTPPLDADEPLTPGESTLAPHRLSDTNDFGFPEPGETQPDASEPAARPGEGPSAAESAAADGPQPIRELETVPPLDVPEPASQSGAGDRPPLAIPEIDLPDVDLPDSLGSEGATPEDTLRPALPVDQDLESAAAYLLSPVPVTQTGGAVAAGVNGEPRRVPVTGLTELTATDLADRLRKAREATELWNETDPRDVPATRRSAAELYRSLASLGEVLTAVDQADPQVVEFRDEVYELLEEIATDGRTANMVQRASSDWMSIERPHQGVILIGTVRSVAKEGNFFETALACQTDHEVTVVSVRDPRQAFVPETRIVLLGFILENPAEKLAGYKAAASTVVLDGFHMVPESRP